MAAETTLIIRDFMRDVMVTFTPQTEVMRAAHLLMEKDVSGAPVLDKLGNIVGFLSEKDIMGVALDAEYYEDAAGTIEPLMTTGKIVTVDANDSIMAAARIFRDTAIKTLPVMLDNRLVGMITRKDVLRAFEQKR